MISNLFVDASLLAFPPKAEESLLEYENIRQFLRAIRDLDCLIYNHPGISVSIRREIEHFLEKEKVFFNMDVTAQKNRITNQRNLKISPREIARIYPLLFCRTRTIRYPCAKVPDNSTFARELENLMAHISCMIQKYGINNQRLVVRALPQNKPVGIQVCKTSALQKEERCYKRRFDTFESVFNEIKNSYSNTICFGDDLYTHEKSLLVIYKNVGIGSDIPDRLFHYLETLSSVVRYLRNLPNALREHDINEVVNSFGCNSAPEGKKYKNCHHRCWHDGTGKSVFNLHLRPKTGYSDTDTMRIYYKWRQDNKKICIGMVCVHPVNCGDCHDAHACKGPH